MSEVIPFEDKYMPIMANLALLDKQQKDIEAQTKAIKADLEKAMDEYSIKSIDNEYLKITRVEGSQSTNVDLKKLQAEEPKLHEELLQDYPKVSNRKAYVRFAVK